MTPRWHDVTRCIGRSLLAWLIGVFGAAGAMAHEFAPARAKPPVSAPAQSDEAERLISIVVLLKTARGLDERQVEDALVAYRESHGLTNETARIVARPPYFQVRLPSGTYVVNDSDEPYLPADEPGIAALPDAGLRAVVAEHRAWLSVDWAAKREPDDLRQAYRDIAGLVAALAGPNAVAVYSPDLGQFVAYSEQVRRSFAGDDPLAVFDATVSDVGVVSMREDDERLVAARRQAAKQWSRFVDAFEHRRGSQFAVKGRLVEGQRVEHVWLAVTALDGDQVHGTLDNIPTALTAFTRGQDLHIRREDLDDWLYLDPEGRTVGGFTLPVLERVAQRRLQ